MKMDRGDFGDACQQIGSTPFDLYRKYYWWDGVGVASSLKNADGQRRVQEDKNQKKDMRSSLTDDGLAFDISGRTLQHVFFLQRLNSCNVSFASQSRQYI